jgi:hypothetical protein
MSTEHIEDTLGKRMAQLKQRRSGLADTVTAYEPPQALPLIIKPAVSSWADLERKLDQVINLPGLWITVRELYEAGQGAELETAAEIAQAKARKSPYNMFAAMVSKKSGNWGSRTLQMVHDTWDTRRNALEVIHRLKLPNDSAKAILAIAWRLKGTIMRYLGMATEQGTGVKNPIGLFFALAKKPSAA